MAKVGKFCLAKRVKVEWLFHPNPLASALESDLHQLRNHLQADFSQFPQRAKRVFQSKHLCFSEA